VNNSPRTQFYNEEGIDLSEEQVDDREKVTCPHLCQPKTPSEEVRGTPGSHSAAVVVVQSMQHIAFPIGVCCRADGVFGQDRCRARLRQMGPGKFPNKVTFAHDSPSLDKDTCRGWLHVANAPLQSGAEG